MSYAVKTSSTTVERTVLRAKAWHIDGRTTGDLLKIAEQGEDVRGWSPSKADALAGHTYLPLIETAKPIVSNLDSIEYIDTYDADNDCVILTWSEKVSTKRELRERFFQEGRELLRQTDWTQTNDYVARHPVKAAKWNTWRHGVRTIVKAMKANIMNPRIVSWEDPPEPLEETIA